ncbi:MBL fold metallo-hydrolase [Streptomyces caelestis]|jgi:glyoxylase-like metal-dependent hydrolase (beta-lactamase superfamily II)|uniref:Glyoxylase-like metal-dependent hydrolase (Beta-lactamase superfamily II) n=1 Tax=Streptomyces caelestis TaxID=36816 RepID=A0A7W9HCT2_9ACTN|nr:MBL fold metallo-hydrolase [Streptomyces caelestis]MBB5799909.1 glyoxylase-like metal-dependent hydrolase (beta-lactamase superfamily II) [Streptomyces caelestis]GGW82560.1 MBL fold metallo-hydrolase [Streptomyces caelestis]
MRADVHHVADGTYLVHGSNTNWVILAEGDAVTLVDTGYPGDREQLLASLAQVGSSPEAVAAVLITHAHNDHLGSAEYLRATYGTPVYLHEAEVPHARREFLHQVSVGTVLRNSWRPGVLPWVVHALRSGGTTHNPVTAPEPFPAAGALDLPGRPVPVHTPGHTDGHCAYHLPGTGVLVSGDALVSGHPTSRVEGPQLLPDMFHHERPRAVASLDLLAELDGELLLPGHGPVHRGSLKDAAHRARERAL